MSGESKSNKTMKNKKEQLGKCIAECRVGVSQSQLAKQISLPRSNMKYIEDGVNAPTAEVYGRLIKELHPDDKQRRKMDRLFMEIRKIPPPDVCQVIIEDEYLMNIVRASNGKKLTKDQYQRMLDLMSSFTAQEEEGAAIHE